MDSRGRERRRVGRDLHGGSLARILRRHDSQSRDLAMQIPRDAVLLRIFIGESERSDHKPLYEAIVLKAREMQMGGATVLRGPMGFGKSSHLDSAKILAFLPVLDKMMGSGLITVEKVQVLQYGDVKP